MAESQSELPEVTPVEMDELDRWLLNELQFDFPLAQRPWDELARRRDDLTGEQVRERISTLKQRGVIRQISPIFDTKVLGYTGVLVAAKAPEARIDEAAAVISAHPGVSHNYRRDAEYNLWFTLAVPPGQDLHEHLKRLAEDAKLEACRPLPNERTFHIGVKLDMASETSSKDKATSPPRKKQVLAESSSYTLSDFDKQAVRMTQGDLSLTDQPFDEACRLLAVDFDALKGWFEHMKTVGALRRIAAILRHRSAGFVANGMVAWTIPEDQIEAAGQCAAQFQEVSHCYQRPAYDDWPYNLYTMVHARTHESCDQTVAQMAAALAPMGVTQYRVLYSSTEYKKARIRYFCE